MKKNTTKSILKLGFENEPKAVSYQYFNFKRDFL